MKRGRKAGVDAHQRRAVPDYFFKMSDLECGGGHGDSNMDCHWIVI